MEDDRFVKDPPRVALATVDENKLTVFKGPGLFGADADLNVVPFPLAQPAEPKVAESDLKNFYIRMALNRFHNTVAHARSLPPGTIQLDELGFIQDLAHVLDYVAKLELEVAEKGSVEGQPPQPE